MGRKMPLIFAIGLQAAGGVLSAFSPWFSGFLAARFLMAVATGGAMIISFVLGSYCNISKRKYRDFITCALPP
jgi:predicted MFS family arabinose efflux permease